MILFKANCIVVVAIVCPGFSNSLSNSKAKKVLNDKFMLIKVYSHLLLKIEAP